MYGVGWCGAGVICVAPRSLDCGWFLPTFSDFLQKNDSFYLFTRKNGPSFLSFFQGFGYQSTGKKAFGTSKQIQRVKNPYTFCTCFYRTNSSFCTFLAVLLWKMKNKKGGYSGILHNIVYAAELSKGPSVPFFEAKHPTQGQSMGWSRTDSMYCTILQSVTAVPSRGYSTAKTFVF